MSIHVRGRGSGRREFPVFECLPYLPLPPSYLVLEVLIQNGEFYININMHQQQKVDTKSQIATKIHFYVYLIEISEVEL